MKTWFRRLVFGSPKNALDPHAFHKVSLVALLAWVGLGADGLSSSAYGPDEAFRALGAHRGLGIFLALATAVTVFVIAYGYARVIEAFPSGGGGYVVASKLLHPRVGVVSGAALLVDYVLTITISIASGADAILSTLPPEARAAKIPLVVAGLVVLTVLNLRGAKESITAIVPVFVLFLVTHAAVLVAALFGTWAHAGGAARATGESVAHTTAALGLFGAVRLFVHAYSMGGGTYTGIEAVSNGVAMMREPRVPTAKRTMLLMAVSLAVTAGGILLAYIALDVHPHDGKTLNAVLFERALGGATVGGVAVGKGLVVGGLFAEGALLFVAAQAGFLDGPRVMANMATDSWLPRRFAALSSRLAMKNGVVLMAAAAALALAYTRGDVSKLVVMYSINVFLTFSLTNAAMIRHFLARRAAGESVRGPLAGHVAGLLLSGTILVVTIVEKVTEGGWVTLVVTATVVAVCFAVRRHYERVASAIRELDRRDAAAIPAPTNEDERGAFVPGPSAGTFQHRGVDAPTGATKVAVVLVGGYGGLGRHAVRSLLTMFPGHFQGIVVVTVAVVDSESFKGAEELEALGLRARADLLAYEAFARGLGLRVASAYAVDTEVSVAIDRLAGPITEAHPGAVFVAGELLFDEESALHRLLHNETARVVQGVLRRRGLPMISVPIRLASPGVRVLGHAAV